MLLAEPLGHLPMHTVADGVAGMTELDEQSPENTPFPPFCMVFTGFSPVFTCFPCVFHVFYLLSTCFHPVSSRFAPCPAVLLPPLHRLQAPQRVGTVVLHEMRAVHVDHPLRL